MIRVTFRTKILSIAGATALAFTLLILESERTSRTVRAQLQEIQTRDLPLLALGPTTTAQLDRLQRGFQDAVAAQDLDTLAATRPIKDKLVERLTTAREHLDAAKAGALLVLIENYYQAAFAVSKRLIAGETGEALVEDLQRMQTLHADTQKQLNETTQFDHSRLANAFQTLRDTQDDGRRTRLAINLLGFVVIFALTLMISRDALRAIGALSAGLSRFGSGDFQNPISVLTSDELGEVADHANQMAAKLDLANKEREVADWQKSGQAALATELQAELDPEDTGEKALALIARHTGRSPERFIWRTKPVSWSCSRIMPRSPR